MTVRWDETWQRLLGWTQSAGAAERLAAQVLADEGFQNVDPSHPLGGRDGGKDIFCERGGVKYVGAVYFPRGPQNFSDIKGKFRADLAAATASGAAEGFAFVTNQELRLAQRAELRDLAPEHFELFHLERVTAVLDKPANGALRRQFLSLEDEQIGQGGDGGGGAITGDGGTIIGGRGGDGGVSGRGGDGGSGFINGSGGLIVGGDGGHAATADGRGGRPVLSPIERYGTSTDLWGRGRGGRGGDATEYTRRLELLIKVRAEYIERFPDDGPYIDAGIDAVRVEWVNQRLDELGEDWHVTWGDQGYVLPPLSSNEDQTHG